MNLTQEAIENRRTKLFKSIIKISHTSLVEIYLKRKEKAQKRMVEHNTHLLWPEEKCRCEYELASFNRAAYELFKSNTSQNIQKIVKFSGNENGGDIYAFVDLSDDEDYDSMRI